MKDNVYFVSGIGTNVGKSYATGWLAKHLLDKGQNIITQKMIQTGNVNYSEDIDVHRKLMGIEHNEDDKQFITAPIIMSYPASPHLAAKIDNFEIDLNKLQKATETLSEKYDMVLLEGAGGLMVPITEDYLTIDYVKDKGYATILITNGTLGSINHTILSLEALKSRNMKIDMVIYNSFFDEDETICSDTKNFIDNYLKKNFKGTKFLIMPTL